MSLKKRKKLLFTFVIIIILVLMFSVVGIVVLYLGGNQSVPNITDDYIEQQDSEDIIIFEDRSEAETEDSLELDTTSSTSGDVVSGAVNSGENLDNVSPTIATGE